MTANAVLASVDANLVYRPADGLSLADVPARIRRFRATYRLSQPDLAALCGVSRETIWRWETVGPGRQTPLVCLALTLLHQRGTALVLGRYNHQESSE